MTSTEPSPPASIPRRHDLDALRAVAMLLGIVLHAGLSFGVEISKFWPVADTRTSGFFDILFVAIHGFRMPLFFLVSGFFTAMLWRKRGLRALLSHRFRRIFLPLLLGIATIVPLNIWITTSISSGKWDGAARPKLAAATTAREKPAPNPWQAIRRGQTEHVKALLADADVNELNHVDAKYQTPLLHEAAMQGDADLLGWLLTKGADVNTQGKDGGTALHAAVFFGRATIVERLLEAGIDTDIRNNYGDDAAKVLGADIELTRFIAKLVEVRLDENALWTSRKEVAAILSAKGLQPPEGIGAGPIAEGANANTAWAGLLRFLQSDNVFHHLWFLWFLCIMVVAYALWALIVNATGLRIPNGLIATPLALLWLVPLTILPGWFMAEKNFGPDTSTALLPELQVLLYYTVFFWFGSLYFDTRDDRGRISTGWPVMLLVSIPVLLIGLHTTFVSESRGVSVACQALYAWLVAFGSMGLFRRLCSRENRAIRYMSDSSYWLYLAHLPLVYTLQWWVRDWPLGSGLKFILLTGIATAILVATYATMVRYTWLGRLLNGPRTRPVNVAKT